MEQKERRKGGRPRLIEEERRAFSVRPGFTEYEFEKLEARAETTGLDVSEFVRRLALNKQFLCVPAINRSALVELSKIGSNINQIAKVTNSSNNLPIACELNLIKDELQKITLTLTINNEIES